jgi:pimeloyl-ACP methyl ester carboxylesterase
MYHANKRVGTAATKNRALVEGSTRKLYAQKHTGNARAGTIRTAKRVGGGVTFAKVARDFSQRMPKKQKQLARDSAILAKLLSNSVIVVDQLKFEKPKTKDFATILNNLKIDRTCLVVVNDLDAIVALFSASHWRTSIEDALSNMTMPCLIFAGEADPLHAGAKKCAESMPYATFISLPDTGHFGVLSQSQVLLPQITRFLANQPREE